jgi:hypothetical protein
MSRDRRLALGTLAVIIVVAGAVAVIAINRGFGTRNYDARIDSYHRVGDDLHIVVFVGIGYGDPIVGYDLEEDIQTVTVTVHAQNRDFGPGTFKNLALYLGIPVTVTLRDVLGNRTVRTAAGSAVPEVSCPDGTVACFVGR